MWWWWLLPSSPLSPSLQTVCPSCRFSFLIELYVYELPSYVIS
jgi:hypothetical protein